MHALVRAAAIVALVAAGTTALEAADRLPARAAGVTESGVDVQKMPCGARTIPDGNACVPIPDVDQALEGQRQEQPATRNASPTRGSNRGYDHLPRRPDRPENNSAYRFPLGTDDERPQVLSGYDLHLRPEAQRRTGPAAGDTGGERGIGHGAIDLAASRGAPVHLVALDGQQGPSEVVFVGTLFGTTVVTAHALKEAGQLRQYLLFYGHLERPGPDASVGATLSEGDVLGYVGDSGSPGNVHLHLEVRRVRPDVDLKALAAAPATFSSALVDQSNTIPCDPRNVLPLR